MSMGFKRSDGAMVFVDYSTNPEAIKNLIINSKGQEIVISISRQSTHDEQWRKRLFDSLIVNDSFPLDVLCGIREDSITKILDNFFADDGENTIINRSKDIPEGVQ